ncbi:GlxA family transcriptional regulator [Actinoplanes sp. NPDC051494]|uniref:GlxA family transcriptional regulator n=1 Tax=Actinoplanes sp. NPDC051494 TaxID=3363907 RepID=UPI00379E61DB
MHTVVVLALDDTIAFDLATPIEVFGRVRLPDGRPGYRLVVAGEESSVGAGPMRIQVMAGLEETRRADLIVVPGCNDLSRPLSPGVLNALRDAAKDGTRIASICVGAFTLAAAGVLDGLRATTHWLASEQLARQYPRIRVDPDVLYTDNGQVLTSAGASAGLDLCLHIVERDHGVAVAADAARLAVAPLQRTGGQGQYILRNRPTDSTATLEGTLQWIEENAHRQLSHADIADAARVSTRTLTRRFQAETGQSPIQWLTGVRIRHAQELLETTGHTVESIAGRVGFTSASNFRSQFAQAVGVSPGAYRKTFRADGN